MNGVFYLNEYHCINLTDENLAQAFYAPATCMHPEESGPSKTAKTADAGGGFAEAKF